MKKRIKRILTIANTFLRKKYQIGFIRNYPFRTSVEFAKNKFKNKELICLEIGVYRGENALNILENLNVKRLYLIDPWEKYLGYDEYNQEKLSRYYKETKKRLKKYLHKIIFIKKMSSSAIIDVPSSLDFIYIDGNHDYKYVKKDIENYYKKLKKGGILAGHDISFQGVSKAFCEFVSKNKLDPFISNMDWWIIKK